MILLPSPAWRGLFVSHLRNRFLFVVAISSEHMCSFTK